MKKSDLKKPFINSVLKSVNDTMNNVKKLNNMAIKNMDINIPNGAISRIFHDGIVEKLKSHNGFGEALDKISDFSYKGERWELKTSRSKSTIGINKVNILEKVKLLMVNTIPEEGKILQIRVLDSRDRYFNKASPGTQIRSLNKNGQEKAIKIYP